MKIFILLGITLLMFSCSQDNSLTVNELSIEELSSVDNYSTCMDSFNPSSNPFIWMAQYHNNNLKEIYAKVQLNPTMETFRSEVYAIAPEIELYPFQFSGIINDKETYEDYFNRQSYLSPLVKDYANQMIDIVYEYNDVISALQLVEEEILNDDNLTNIERDALLQGYAICQGSYCYWENNHLDWSNSKQVPDWLKTVISADAVTALSMAIGIGIGWLIPPVTVGATIWTAGSSVGVSAATGLVLGANWVLEQFTDWW